MTPPSKQPTIAEVKFSTKRLALAFAIAGISDAIGAFANPLPPLVWVVDFATALLLFLVLGRQWLLLPGLVLEAIPGLEVIPLWLLVVGAIMVLGNPRPTFQPRATPSVSTCRRTQVSSASIFSQRASTAIAASVNSPLRSAERTLD
jgi:hypothetical protein